MVKRHWWKFYNTLPQNLEWQLQSWDCSFKDSDGTDYVVGQVWGVKDADIYLLDQVRDRMDFPVTIQAIENMTKKWPQATMKLIEDKANGPAVISMMRHKIGGLIPVEPRGSKEARASAVSPLIEAGNVYLPSPAIAPWVNDFIEECSAFPNGANDDQVDAMSQALGRFMYTGVVPDPAKPDTREYPEEDFEDYRKEGEGFYD
jgi:predicted phage terminase large subunit-like protein